MGTKKARIKRKALSKRQIRYFLFINLENLKLISEKSKKTKNAAKSKIATILKRNAIPTKSPETKKTL